MRETLKKNRTPRQWHFGPMPGRTDRDRDEMIHLLIVTLAAALLTGAVALPFTLPGGSLAGFDAERAARNPAALPAPG